MPVASTLFLLVGLGNPGSGYEQTRHNAGFVVADQIIRQHELEGPKDKYRGQLYQGVIDGHKVYVLKPMTFMNNSGVSVLGAMSFFKIPPENVIVFYDELDLLPGKVRVKQGGGDGGHNGIRSIDSHMGKNYWRVRLGIGHPGDKDLVTPYVLGKFSAEEATQMQKVAEAVSAHIGRLLARDNDGFMSKVAHDVLPQREKVIRVESRESSDPSP